MKFTDGQWMTRPGFELVQAMHPHDVRAGEAALDAYASPRDLTHRGARLDLPLLTVRFSSPMKNVIRVQAFRHKGVRERTPSFELFANGEPPVETGANEDEAWLISGELSVRVRRRGSWAVDFYDGNRRLTGSRTRSLAHITGADGTTYVREELDLGVGECVYGLGERFTPFVKTAKRSIYGTGTAAQARSRRTKRPVLLDEPRLRGFRQPSGACVVRGRLGKGVQGAIQRRGRTA
ncbi:hypothetical protein PACILC2_28050 [Paenibacillus cisolokensis]|uniref:Glycoside hydrolase family 31 N-terminal domain-containing protein n=1 Tax=Paenibacillus cisolokensis TaxID=1658519 RepID=A0ABQ4N7S1_9BACL|nr:hypothetical protein PACILC2_28050 [Paenibacillus cisolokensis]